LAPQGYGLRLQRDLDIVALTDLGFLGADFPGDEEFVKGSTTSTVPSVRRMRMSRNDPFSIIPPAWLRRLRRVAAPAPTVY